MNIHLASFLFRLVTLLVLVTLTTCTKNSTKKAFVNLESLPEPFQDDYLPSREFNGKPKNVTCSEFMGCYEKIPIYGLSKAPMDLKTVFTIRHKNQASEIVIEDCVNCLENDPEKCDQYPFDLHQLKNSPFKPGRRTIVIIGGFHSKTKGNWEERVADLWSQLESVNVILVDWQDGCNTVIYNSAAINSRPVARQLTVLLYYLAKLNGVNDLFEQKFTESLYLIGHSLGAHMAGFVGDDLAGGLGRITGLDPAGPSFDSLPGKFRIDKSDAQFVDIMHTNAGSKVISLHAQYGSDIESGHIDLWANNGRSQPGCDSDLFGCSHRRAGSYYESFLKDVIAMRANLVHNYKPMYRLRAYRGETYDEFHDGTGLVKHCPIASLDDNDLSYEDLNFCSIPIDYIAWPTDYRNELSSTYGLDFESPSSPNRFYFYTRADPIEQLDHYMIRVRVAKTENSSSRQTDENGVVRNDGCAIQVSISMASGLGSTTKINNFKLIDFEDHREVAFPYLAPTLVTKGEIARLDSHDFYVERDKGSSKEFISDENLQLFRKSIDRVFPSSVSLDGFSTSQAGKKGKRGVLDTIKGWFKKKFQSGDNEEDESDETTDKSAGVDCELPIESFVVQPLRKFRRHLSAFYKRDCGNSTPRVKVVVLGVKEASPKGVLFDESAGDCEANNLELTLDTIIVGPSLPVEREDEIYDGEAETPNKAGRSSIRQATADTRHWLKLTVLLLSVVSITILILILMMKNVKLDELDRRNLMMRRSEDSIEPNES